MNHDNTVSEIYQYSSCSKFTGRITCNSPIKFVNYGTDVALENTLTFIKQREGSNCTITIQSKKLK